MRIDYRSSLTSIKHFWRDNLDPLIFTLGQVITRLIKRLDVDNYSNHLNNFFFIEKSGLLWMKLWRVECCAYIYIYLKSWPVHISYIWLLEDKTPYIYYSVFNFSFEEGPNLNAIIPIIISLTKQTQRPANMRSSALFWRVMYITVLSLQQENGLVNKANRPNECNFDLRYILH